MSVLPLRTLVIAIISFCIVACGGGGGGGGGTPPVNQAPQNSLPTANAGGNQTVDEQTNVTISGSGTDSDGSIASYSWTQTQGTSVTLSGTSTAQITFTAPTLAASDTLTFQLTVTDDDGATDTDAVSITVNHRKLMSEISFSDSNLAQCVSDTDLTYVDELTSLECKDMGIADAGGIEELISLEILDLGDNLLTSIDVSNNIALHTLWLRNNDLVSINVSQNVALQSLDLIGNDLTSIDVSNNTLLIYLVLSDNLLTSIDVSNNIYLEWLWLGYNNLASIDVTANTALTQLELIYNANITCSEIQVIQTQFPTLQLGHSVAGCGSGSWISGLFEPAAQFAAQCVAPRTGIDPSTGVSFPDIAGTRLDENNWLRSWSNDLYLWYDEITDRNPADYSTPEYFSLLKTFEISPSGSPKDRFHGSMGTEEFRALFQSGVSVGYGFTLSFIQESPPRQVVVAYTEPNSPATAQPANLARGATLLEVDGVDLVNSAETEYLNAVNNGLFGMGLGESHDFTVQDLGSLTTRSFTMVAEAVTSTPVQNVSTIGTAFGTVGYMLFNDHIATAEQLLMNAFNQLKAANISDLVLDIRYNGGGYLGIASEIAYMIGGSTATAGETFFENIFNDKHRVFNPETGQLLTPWPFQSTAIGYSAAQGEALPSLDLTRVFVLTGPTTCSASETIINGLRGIDVEVIQIGSTTCGKPYGFLTKDNCGTTYFSINFREVNAKGFGDYADGFSPSNTNPSEGAEIPGCSIKDDFTHALGDPQEGRLAAALAYRVDQTCPAPTGFTARMLASPAANLSAVDGKVYKSPWLENRILWR